MDMDSCAHGHNLLMYILVCILWLYTVNLSQADFVDTTPVTIDISISDAQQPLSFTFEPEMEQFGGPLHPVLRRYIAGDDLQPLSLLKKVMM